MGLKTRLKKNDWLRGRVKRLKVFREYFLDARFMNDHLLDGGTTTNHLSYRVMLRVHSIEKGLSYRAPRAFGADKVHDLIKLMTSAPEDFRDTTAFRMGVEVLTSWIQFNEARDWGDSVAMQSARNFVLEASLGSNDLSAGVREVHDRDPERWTGLPFREFVASRHSTRRYTDGEVDRAIIDDAVSIALMSPSACNRQMVRVRLFDDVEKKRLLYDTLHGTGGVDFDSCQLGVITFDTQSLEFYGERNQGYLNVGLFAMSFVYALHWKGIGSCLLQFGNTFSKERTLVRELGIPAQERIAVGISMGNLEKFDQVPASIRRALSEVLTK